MKLVGSFVLCASALLLVATAVAFVPYAAGRTSRRTTTTTSPLLFGRPQGTQRQQPHFFHSAAAASTTPCPEIVLRPRMGMEMALVACG